MISTLRISLREIERESSYNGHDASSVMFMTTDRAKKDFEEFV
jgi:hypothetical protein